MVVADADVWCEGIAEAVAAIDAECRWAIPHLKVHRLTPEATADVLAGAEPQDQPTEMRPYNGMVGGGIVAIARETLLEVPLDPRFVGWGREDCAWREALITVTDEWWRGDAPLVHLWHDPQPQPDASRTRGFPHSEALYERYAVARTAGESAMRELLAEARTSAVPDIRPMEALPVYRYFNENTRETVEREERVPRFDAADNWTLLGEGEQPAAEAPAATDGSDGNDEMSVEELAAELGSVEDEDLVKVYRVFRGEMEDRDLLSEEDEDEPDGDRLPTEYESERDTQTAIEAEVETPADAGDANAEQTEASSEPPTEIDASPAAKQLAEAEEIDLGALTGSGDDNKITVTDVREAVAAKESGADRS